MSWVRLAAPWIGAAFVVGALATALITVVLMPLPDDLLDPWGSEE